MKNKGKILAVMMLLFLLNIQLIHAQDNALKNYIWRYQGKNREQKLGGYFSLDGVYHDLNGDATGILGLKGGLVWNSRWGLGLVGQALWYDTPLDEVVNDGTYHLQSGMAGMFVSYMIPVKEKWRVNFMLASGSGVALYQYDKDSREDKTWYEEIIDRDTFGFIQPTVEIRRYLGGHWWLGAEVSFRSTSEINLEDLPVDFMNGVNPGISLTYGLF